MEMHRIRTISGTSALVFALALSGAAANGAPAVFPDTVALPDGWDAEGVATGAGTDVYAGSLAGGAIWKADLRTGEGSILVPARDGGFAVGLNVSRGLLFVAGGPAGSALVYDTRTGDEVAALQVTDPGGGFVNDVIVTPDAAWFTNSFAPELYRVELEDGAPTGAFETVPLSGDWVQMEGFNANGIEATPDGSALIVINSRSGDLFRVDPGSGVATLIDSDAELTAGDGILLRGKELAVVRNRFNQISVLRLSPDLSSATLTKVLTDPDFAVPTTVAAFGSTLYAVNARFGLPAGPFDIVKVDGTGPAS
jgi:sugar lactone lactonase YvrE